MEQREDKFLLGHLVLLTMPVNPLMEFFWYVANQQLAW
jgi:hypothetical protein